MSGRDPIRDWLDSFVRRGNFLGKYRYYASVLSRLDPVEDPSVPVMAVSRHGRRFYLHVNVDYFLNPPANVRYVAGVLLHEVHHLVLGHLTNPRLRGLPGPDLMELAMEISANEFIREELPGSPPRVLDYARFGVKSGQSTMERYEVLASARRAGRPLPAWRPVDGHLLRGVCGSVGPDAPGDNDHGRAARLVKQAVAEAEAGMTEGERDKARQHGQAPGWFIEELAAEGEPGHPVDWRAALRMFVEQARQPRHTYNRPNRRFPGRIGEVPGRAYSLKDAPAQRLLVAIDTSGSMTSGELAEVARHLRKMRDFVRITVAECDKMIQRVYPFEGELTEVAGRGGTDLRPVFAREFLRAHRPTGVVYFTDGWGPYPVDDPGVRTLWVLTPGAEFFCPWGRRVYLDTR